LVVTKIGLELIAAQEAGLTVAHARRYGAKVFLDIKLDDIPTTVARAVHAARHLGVDLINVHATAGQRAMAEAVKAAGGSMMVAAVTVLTSLDVADLSDLGFDVSGEYLDADVVGRLVCVLAKQAAAAGIPALICSPQDLHYLRLEGLLEKFKTITPGVRPSWAGANDQKRIMTPTEALKAGADYLVIGRPITIRLMV
jgi:orotidine-5'-phosphate decarboxylase